jgi:hypothetical protein
MSAIRAGSSLDKSNMPVSPILPKNFIAPPTMLVNPSTKADTPMTFPLSSYNLIIYKVCQKIFKRII